MRALLTGLFLLVPVVAAAQPVVLYGQGGLAEGQGNPRLFQDRRMGRYGVAGVGMEVTDWIAGRILLGYETFPIKPGRGHNPGGDDFRSQHLLLETVIGLPNRPRIFPYGVAGLGIYRGVMEVNTFRRGGPYEQVDYVGIVEPRMVPGIGLIAGLGLGLRITERWSARLEAKRIGLAWDHYEAELRGSHRTYPLTLGVAYRVN